MLAKYLVQTVCLCMCSWLPLLSQAGEVAVPESIEGVTSINAEALIELAGQYANLYIVDSRKRSDRQQGYIQGSLNLPDVETSCASLKVELPKTDVPIVFYCNGVKCGRSNIAIGIAKDCGYTQLYWFRGGFEEWKQKGYPFLKM